MTARYLTCIGDARKRSTWSGTPYHLIESGRRHGFITDGWSVSPERIRWRRNVWNMAELLRTGDRGGYQYTKACAKRLLAQVPEEQKRGEVISTFPVFPPAQWLPGTVNFYIDATLTQIFRDYGKAALVSTRVQRDALAQEREQYSAAEHICCMSSWPAQSLVEHYDVPKDKIHVIPPGANIDAKLISPADNEDLKADSTLRLGFVGKDWQRKNLAFLLDIADRLASTGIKVKVLAAGFGRGAGPRHRLLESVGYIDKDNDMAHFIEFVRSLHFGCLFSHAEASAIFSVECLRLGVPVLTWRVGGMPDLVPQNCGKVFPFDVGATTIADWLVDVVKYTEEYRRLVANVVHDAERFTWDGVVSSMQNVWAGYDLHSYVRLLNNG